MNTRDGKNPSIVRMLSKFMTDIGNSIVEIADSVSVDQALEVPRNVFHTERTAIETAIRMAEDQLQVEKWISQSEPASRDLYFTALADVEAAFNKRQAKRSNIVYEKPEATTLPPKFAAPLLSYSSSVNNAIEESFKRLIQERNAYFIEKQHQIQSQKQLKMLVREWLQKLGHSEYWIHIAGE